MSATNLPRRPDPALAPNPTVRKGTFSFMRLPWFTRRTVSSETGRPAQAPSNRVRTVSPDELKRELASGHVKQLVDVRSPGEFAQGHIPGAKCLPLGTLPKRLAELAKDEPITLVCLSGHRSHQAASLLMRAGFTDVRHLVGGMLRWQGATQRG